MMTDIKLTHEQQRVVDFAVERMLAQEPLTTIGGYAGVGKSTIVGAIVNILRQHNEKARFAFACYTGKAKSVLEQKLRATDALREDDFCGTLHSLLYAPVFSYIHKEKEKTIEKIVTFQSAESRARNFTAVIVDEASMVTEEIFKEISALKIPILAVGDHAQLPPVFGSFNLMQDPMIRLEKIHRQAEGNPIIRASILAREEGIIPYGVIGENVLKTRDGSIVNTIDDIQDWSLICGTNKKRVRLNAWMRQRIMGTDSPDPVPGDRLICLQNNHKERIFNGQMGTLISSRVQDGHWLWASIDMGDFIYNGLIFRWQFGKEKTLKKTVPEAPDIHPDDFGDLFDYGCCCTVWKFQGSEADNVIFYEESAVKHFMRGTDWNKFLYTGITRAKKRLIIVGE